MAESHLSVEGFRVAGEPEFFDAQREKRPGAFYFERVIGIGEPDRVYLLVLVPSEEMGAAPGRLPLHRHGAVMTKTSWEWDGNEERPTLSPSIHCVEHWHGYLRAGRFESC